ncbi:pRL2-8 [Streptomyces albireticuli]|jgi:hypothetical protein|uniref:PRL2-8 n=1 Tax=Streptomyces albireticuli TaxID=1940 RepID=A0A2A2DF38_9ACTN|nr:pRL2-8 [Streptomyces albireticuli]MCD9143448.1 pRL2-8 [Streptomyces albireticuli]MCD9164807.1 pRL2-8 [Streptomyces albireticuli]MCD9191565.1 pRL2-8 [Streptomyces albireticuli]PAU50047.1 pRL2-8 [Streptomyces albireticuli]
MADPNNPPPGECPQCWRHAHDKSIHARQDRRTDCAECVDHMLNGHPTLVPGRRRWW